MPRNGDYGLTTIGGLLGILVGIGQVLLGDGSRWTHAFVIVDADAGLAVEARPAGAGLVNYRDVYGSRDTVYSHLDLTDAQREAVAAAARTLIGRGYNWADYLALALYRLGWWQPRWLVRYVGNTDRLICSQLVDEAERLGGVHLFDDGRAPDAVTPGDLTYVGNVH